MPNKTKSESDHPLGPRKVKKHHGRKLVDAHVEKDVPGSTPVITDPKFKPQKPQENPRYDGEFLS
jgi:hypothetical protein